MAESREALACEFDRLKRTLQQAQDKFLIDWTGEELERTLADNDRQHIQIMAERKDQLGVLQETLSGLKELKLTTSKAHEDQQKQIDEVVNEIRQINLETDNILMEKEGIQDQIKTLRTKLDREKELLLSQEKATEACLVELRKAADWFQSRMGLQFKKTEGDKIQVIFTCIDRDQPSGQFFFSLKIDEGGAYIVSDCKPAIADLEKLSEKLNETNDFRSFMVNMRRRFKDLSLE